jgi:hypothetical protein
MKILIGVLVIVLLVGLGYVVYTSSFEKAEEVPVTEDVTQSKLAADDQRTLLVGVWRSNDDAKFTREFRENGQVIDMYASEDTPLPTQGIWSLVTDMNAEPVDIAADIDTTVLKLEFPEETMYFGLASNTATTLELVYYGGRGGVLTFTKVQ